ncbi:MAG: Crp/Fnr family transcriptional regulator [Sphingomonadaceae bacterium]
MAASHFVRKLESFQLFSQATETAIQTLATLRTRTLNAGDDLISEGDEPRTIYLVIDGWACRQKMLDDSRRQIMAFFLPGDLCDLHVYILDEMDHSISALTPVTYASITPSEFETFCDDHPRVVRSLWWATLVGASIQREWLVSAGQRSAYEALAHLCCELYFRLRLIGLTAGGKCNLPLTQSDIADALGLTQPHVSRTIAELNASKLATLRRRYLTVIDLPGLMAAGRFNPNYLHYRESA